MKRKWLVMLLVVIVVLLLLIGGFFSFFHWAFRTSLQKSGIQEGFSPKLVENLKTQYGITIPDKAQFIKGYNLPDWRDSYVAILFECPIAEPIEDDSKYHPCISDCVRQLLKLDSTRYSEFGRDTRQFHGADWYDDLGGVMEYAMYDHTFTIISYTAQQDKILIRVIGWRPGASFP